MEPAPRNLRRKPRSRRLQLELTPLAYMLGVVNDCNADPVRRDRMAIAAAQYVHPRAADYRKGVKDLQAERADTAGVATVWEDDLHPDGLRQ